MGQHSRPHGQFQLHREKSIRIFKHVFFNCVSFLSHPTICGDMAVCSCNRGTEAKAEMPSQDPAFILTPSNATYNCYQNKLFKHKYPSPILKIVKWLPNCLPTPLRFKALLISQASSCHTLQLTNWGRTGNALDLHQLTPAHA